MNFTKRGSLSLTVVDVSPSKLTSRPSRKRSCLMEKLRDRMSAKNAKPGDLISEWSRRTAGPLLEMLQAIALRAGVVGFELHRFRKTYSDTLHDEGVPVMTIMKRLGHCSLDVTFASLRGRDAEDEREQEFANNSALAVYA